jgi:hypothetical protein
VLAIGVYLSDKKNLARQISLEIERSSRYTVDQVWASVGKKKPSFGMGRITRQKYTTRTPKFAILNQLLSTVDIGGYDYLLVLDDDITLPRGFVDEFLDLQQKHDLALAQPARTHNSFLDHAIVEQQDQMAARRTRFVEIGPVFSIRRDAILLLTPFDESAPMGWGLDFVWPVILERHKLRQGIIDATPIDHSIRKPFTQYDGGAALDGMNQFLSRHEHLRPEDAFVVLEAFPKQ